MFNSAPQQTKADILKRLDDLEITVFGHTRAQNGATFGLAPGCGAFGAVPANAQVTPPAPTPVMFGTAPVTQTPAIFNTFGGGGPQPYFGMAAAPPPPQPSYFGAPAAPPQQSCFGMPIASQQCDAPM